MNYSRFQDYLELCKPRVVALMLLTAIVGMHLASPGFVSLRVLFFGTIGIAFAAASAAVINHLIDRHIDLKMRRTEKRPVATGKIAPKQAFIFAGILALLSMAILIEFINPLTAFLSFLTLVGYAGVYTLFLKRATPQNIVIGGLAGAAPPLLGWCAVTGTIDPYALLLVLIIYTWTPPHFWALAIYRREDYANAKIPMLPVTHGVQFTKLCIVLYTLLLTAATMMPFAIGGNGLMYFIGALVLNARFFYWAIKLMRSDQPIVAMKTFYYSITYLGLLFLLLLVDHYYQVYVAF